MNENQNNPASCPKCGAPLPPNAPEGLCPRCVIAASLAAETELKTGGSTPDGTKIIKQAPAPLPSPEEIAKLFPQFQIIEALGRGGMGAVYKARQPRLDRFVALKILSPDKQGDPQFAERFEREARLLARLQHPNIVAVYDFGEVQGNFYLLMEFVDGLTLRQLLQTRKLAPEEALLIVPKICEALQFAHQQGIVHRDVKPENILLDKAGVVKIADFGIAKIVGQQSQTGITQEQQVLGTPHYMAPEQVEHPQTVDHRADIYSLGVVLYEMLTGELPLGKFAPPSSKVQVDVRLDEVVLRALEKEPARRYQQASQVKTDVETISHLRAAPRAGSPPADAAALLSARANAREKTILPAFLLAFFFGVFGAHRIYVGKIRTGLLQLAAVGWCVLLIILCATSDGRGQPTLGILLGFSIAGCLIMAAIDSILILCKAFTDGQGRRIADWVHVKPNGHSAPAGIRPAGPSAVPPVFGSTPAGAPGSAQGPAGEGASSSAIRPPVTGTGKITAPAVGLMIAGAVKLISALSAMFLFVGPHGGWLGQFMRNFGVDFFPDLGVFPGFAILIFKVIPALLIIVGGFQMLQLRSYAWAIAAGILSVAFCSLIGFPIGIWALIVLTLADVRAVFASAASLPGGRAKLGPWILGGAAALLLVVVLGMVLVGLAMVLKPSASASSAGGADNGDSSQSDAPAEVVDSGSNEDSKASAVATPFGVESNSAAAAAESGTNEIRRVARSGAAANFSKTFAVLPGGKLTLKVDRGDVHVTGSDENNVDVQVAREVKRAGDAEAARIIREHRIELRQDGNEITLNAGTPSRLEHSSSFWFWDFFTRPDLEVRYEIKVPRKFDLQLRTAGGGIEVADVRGSLNAETTGGGLDFDRIDGDVDGHTLGGSIHAAGCQGELKLQTQGGGVTIEEFSGPKVQAGTMGGSITADFVTGPTGECSLHTAGGNVTARLPASAAFTLDAHTVGGAVNTELPVQTEGGHHESSLKGTINGGGPILKLETMGGSIDVLKR